MKVTILHGHLHLGGIETLLLKLARELKGMGHAVTVIAGPEGDSALTRALEESATVVRMPASYLQGIPHLGQAGAAAGTDVFFVCGTAQLLLAEALRERYSPSARLTAGAYSPWEYWGRSGPRRFDWKLVDRLVRAMPDENFVFVNKACREEHREVLGRAFDTSPVIGLPIDAPPPRDPRRVDRDRIVWIGRLVPTKPAPFHLLDVLAQFRERGRHFRFDVYGDGASADDLRRAVARRDLEDVVRLHGTVKYEDIPQVLSDAYVCVAMATAAFEAAALGVPTLMAYESETEAVTLGFVHELMADAMGERGSPGTRYPFVDKLLELERADAADYDAIARKGRERATTHGSQDVARSYESAFRNSQPFRFSLGRAAYPRAVLSALAWQARALLGSPHPDADRWTRRIERSP